MVPTIAALTEADEFFNHQIVNTHATVDTADRSWTEKVWFTFARKDGSLQASFGLGKYSNRNVLDGFAGVQRATTQYTVRASRVLRPALEAMAVGPLRYDVIVPLREVRVTLTENAAQPISFDLTFTDLLPAFFEGRDREIHHGRLATDVVRYHQAGTATGWIEIDGERIAVDPDEWFAIRDHSWGVREHVGVEPTDLVPAVTDASGNYHFHWTSGYLERPDGRRYGLHYYFRASGASRTMTFFTGYIEEADGRQIPLLHVWPELRYRKSDRAVLGGTIHAVLAGEGRATTERSFEVEALDPDMGFHLHPAKYGAWKGQIHGSYQGPDFLDGETIEDVNHPGKLANNPRWEVRDRPLRIREGDATGFANIESLVRGVWPQAEMIDDDAQ